MSTQSFELSKMDEKIFSSSQWRIFVKLEISMKEQFSSRPAFGFRKMNSTLNNLFLINPQAIFVFRKMDSSILKFLEFRKMDSLTPNFFSSEK